MRFPYEHEVSNESHSDYSPKAIIARSEQAPIVQILKQHDQTYSEDLIDNVQYSIERMQERYGKAPFESEILDAMSNKRINSYFELEKWLFDWEREHLGEERALEAQYTDYISWYEPQNQHEAIVLLPITHSWEALAYLHWYGAESVSTEAAIAMLRHWNELYGAELVEHYGTMLHLITKRKPNSAVEAFTLAKEQEALAPCTTALPGESIRDHTRSLLAVDKWFLHERP